MQLRRRRTPDGRYRFDRELGIHRSVGRALATKERVLITELVHTDLSPEELYAKYDFAIDGAAPFRAVVARPGTNGFPDGAFLVEAMPDGASLATMRVEDRDRSRVALDVARTVSRAHSCARVLLGLRPDLVFVGDEVTIVPRSVDFLMNRSVRVKTLDGDGAFGGLEPVEYFIDPSVYSRTDPRVDVYLLALVITWVWTGKHAFAKTAETSFYGDLPDAMREGTRDVWPGPPELDALIGSMLHRDPAKRPEIEDVVTVLARFAAI